MKKSTKVKPTKVSQYLDIKTFTYFIPAPPKRKTGFREREFDKIMHGVLADGHDVIDWKMESVPEGVYVVFILGSTKRQAKGPGLDLHEKHALQHKYTNPDLEVFEDDE